MNECYSYLLLGSLLGIVQHSLALDLRHRPPSLPNVTIQHVCENDLLVLQCFQANETIQIVRSMYGRTSQRLCNDDLTHRSFDRTCANIEQSKYQSKLR